MKRVAFVLSLFLSLTVFPTSSLADNAQDAVDAANEATDAAIAATDAAIAATEAAIAAAEAADSINVNLRDKIEEAIWVAKTTGSVTIVDVSLGITNCTQRIIDFTKSKEYAESKVLAIQSILDKQDLEVTTRSRYSGTQRTWQSSVNSYSRIINNLTIEKSYLQSAQEKINNAAAEKVAADLKAKQDADAKAVADKAAADLKAKQEADAKAAAAKAAAELKAKQDAEAKAAADKAAADKAAADKAAADKAAADKAAADLLAEQKAAAAKALANKKTTITCIKGKSVKKVTAVKPVCPKGYKKK